MCAGDGDKHGGSPCEGLGIAQTRQVTEMPCSLFMASCRLGPAAWPLGLLPWIASVSTAFLCRVQGLGAMATLHGADVQALCV